MVSLSDKSAFNWIVNGRDVQSFRADSPEWEGNFVSHCIPPVFPAYCKVFHPIYEDPTVPNLDLTWDEDRRTSSPPPDTGHEDNGLAEVLNGSILVRGTAGVEGAPDTRVSWRTLAERYGLSFHSAFNAESFAACFGTGSWPRYLLGPTEGTLDRKTCEALIEVLKPFDQGQRTYFRFSDCLLNDLPHLYAGRLDEASSFVTKPHFGCTPEYWWPEDESWCVCTDWDLPFTLVGGSRSLLSACLGNHLIECLEVRSDTRIDYLADDANLEKS